MKENLTGRVGRIISGRVNALISAVEYSAPEQLAHNNCIKERLAALKAGPGKS